MERKKGSSLKSGEGSSPVIVLSDSASRSTAGDTDLEGQDELGVLGVNLERRERNRL